jgi:branched-chain amino acid transport system substrate-binding protein
MNKENNRFFNVMFGLTIFACLFFGSLSAVKENHNTLKIGAILPLTGDSADWGEQGKYGIEIAVEEINSKGGINGRKIEVVYEDSQAIPKNGITAIQKLVNVDKVPAIVGDIVSATTLAMAPIAEKSEVVLIAPTASAPAISHAGEYIYRVWPSDFLEGRVLAEFLIKKNHKRACILYIKTDYGTGLREIFTKTFEQGGGEVVFTYGYKQDETNFKPALLKAKIKKTDAVYLISYYKDAALILKQSKEIGLNTQFFGVTAVESPKLLEIAGETAEGLIYPIITDFDPDNPTPVAKKFIDSFRKKFGVAPDWASSHTHDAIIVIAEAMRVGGFTGSAIKKAIDSQKRFNGVTGKIIFDENGDVVEKPVTIKTVQDGKFEIYK